LIADAPQSWALMALMNTGIPSNDLRCKSWMEFTRNGAPTMDFVIGLDRDTAHKHPSWKGQPETALWEFDRVDVRAKGQGHSTGIETLQILHALRRRLELLVSLHSRVQHPSDLRHDLRDLGYVGLEAS
jgi:hypothetical protein